MKQSDFEGYVNARQSKCKEVLIDRARFYATDADRLQNFKDIALDLGIRPELVCQVLMSKHRIALRDAMKAPELIPDNKLSEWITDLHNYLHLLEALLVDTGRVGPPELAK